MALIQSVIFLKSYGERAARHWLQQEGFHSNKIDVTPHTLRFRQHDPHTLEAHHYHFATKPFSHGYFVIAYSPHDGRPGDK